MPLGGSRHLSVDIERSLPHHSGKSVGLPAAPKTAKLRMKEMTWVPPSKAPANKYYFARDEPSRKVSGRGRLFETVSH